MILDKIKEAYIRYIELGYSSRSSEPANIMHDAIKESLESLLEDGDGFSIRTNNHNGEYLFSSNIHEKRIDITIVDTALDTPVVAISFKMPLASVNKNLKNYFEMNIGDTTLVRQNGTPFYYFMVLDANSIKFSSSRVERDLISETSISSFSKVMLSSYYDHFRPNHTFITKVDFGDSDYKTSYYGEAKSLLVDNASDHIDIVRTSTMSAEVYKNNGTWTNNFIESFERFIETIKLEIMLYKLRREM